MTVWHWRKAILQKMGKIVIYEFHTWWKVKSSIHLIHVSFCHDPSLILVIKWSMMITFHLLWIAEIWWLSSHTYHHQCGSYNKWHFTHLGLGIQKQIVAMALDHPTSIGIFVFHLYVDLINGHSAWTMVQSGCVLSW